MKPRAFAVLAFFTLILILGVTPACSSGAAEASLAMPVRGVWMHPGLFGPDKEAAVEKMRTTLDEYAKAGINTLIMLVKNTSGHVYYASEIGVPTGPIIGISSGSSWKRPRSGRWRSIPGSASSPNRPSSAKSASIPSG